MPFADIRGHQIHYEDHGSGTPVFLLHHGFAGSKMWKGIYPAIVDAGYRVIMFDRRGYGQSEPGEDFEQYYLSDEFNEENVRDMAQLAAMLDLDSFHIVGQCEGGVVGVYYAGAFPQQVKSLVTGSTLCFSTTTMTEFNSVKFPLRFDELDDGLRKKILEWHGEDHAERLYEIARTHGGSYGIDKFDLRPLLGFVRCPALVLYPDRSALFEVEQAVAFYRGLAKGELAVIARCGHNTYENKPEAYLWHTLNFLNRVNADSGTVEEDFSMTCIAPAAPGRGLASG